MSVGGSPHDVYGPSDRRARATRSPSALVALFAYETGQSFWLLLLLGVVIPFALWNAIMGLVVFVHHTHPNIAWFTKSQ